MYYRPGLRGADFRSGVRANAGAAPATFRATAVRRILIPVDSSDGASGAIEYVVDSVRPRNAEVHLLNVQRLTMKGDFALDAMLHIESRAKRAIGMEILNYAGAPLDAIGISCRTTVLFGQPAEMIAHYAREQCIHAIILQTNRPWLNRLVSGAVAAKVTRLADTEVILVSPTGRPVHFRRANNALSRVSRAVLVPVAADQQRA